MLKLVVLMVMAGVLVLAASSNSLAGFGRDAGFDGDALPEGG
jgi:predicted small secreted protein